VWLSLPASIHNIAESEAEFNLLAITTTTTTIKPQTIFIILQPY
jgi:hypothetical protein